ncbi:MAG: CBS domain-containing protein [Clostridia bacterium]|nr:CBS domain-containing protein [Clostridia bacterium]
MKVKDCMCNDVCCVKPETKIQEVAKLMSQNHIGCIPVCDNNNCICGIITDRDVLLRCVACEKDTNQTPVSDIMTCNVCTCTESDELSNAESKMSQNQIRRLPVCNEKNEVVGILTMGNLLQQDREIGKQEVCSTLENICNCNQTKNAE